MGLCGSSISPEDEAKLKEEKRRTKEIDRAMHKDHQVDQQVNKLLLLGAGESGKSTLFKQMLVIYGKGFSDDDRREYIEIIHTNIIRSMKTLIQQSDELRGKVNGTTMSSSVATSRKVIEDLKDSVKVDVKLAPHFQAVWRDPGIQKTFESRAFFQLTDSTDYYLNKIGELAKESWVPNEQDVLRSRVRTTGIAESDFVIDGNQFKIFDVGGQRNERKKWIHCFQNVTAVLFVAALSEYDMGLFEDQDTNRMDEALNLFDEICNSRWFKNTSIILMLNKRDLFAEKIRKVPLTVCFQDYKGDNSFEDASEFIKKQFEARNKTPTKQIYTHITCATDTDNMRHVINAVKDILIRRNLQEGGLLS
jgi:GTPase SAR1 family protein